MANAMVPMTLPNMAGIEVSDMRNGNPGLIRAVIVSGAVSIEYRFLFVGNQAATPELALGYIAAHFRSYIAKFPQPITAEHRKAALVLAVCRSAIIVFWRILPNDINRDELGASLYSVQGNTSMVAAQPAVGAQPAVNFVPANFGNVVTVNNAQLAADIAVAQAAPDMTDLERRVVPTLIKMAVGLPAMVGLNLCDNTHHYTPDHYPVFKANEEQFLRLAEDDVRTWWTDHQTFLQGVLNHKVCHPISSALMMGWAMDPETKTKLVMAKCGAASVRLPAKASLAQNGSSVVALFDATADTIRVNGGTLRYERLRAAVEVASGGPFPVVAGVVQPLWPATPAVVGLDGAVLEPAFAVGPVSVAGALMYIAAVLAEKKVSIAFCYGVLTEMAQRIGGRNTLLRSYTLKKYAANDFSANERGYSWSALVTTRNRQLAREGTLPVSVNLIV